jgi:hypothetical protein
MVESEQKQQLQDALLLEVISSWGRFVIMFLDAGIKLTESPRGLKIAFRYADESFQMPETPICEMRDLLGTHQS